MPRWFGNFPLQVESSPFPAGHCFHQLHQHPLPGQVGRASGGLRWASAPGIPGSKVHALPQWRRFGHVLGTARGGDCQEPSGAGGTRTHDLRFRKPSLYPAELQPHGAQPIASGDPPSEDRQGWRFIGPAGGCVTCFLESSRGDRDRWSVAGFRPRERSGRLRKVRAPRWPGLPGNARCGRP